MDEFISTRKARQIVEAFGIGGNVPDVLKKAAERKDIAAQYDPAERDRWTFSRNSLILWLLDEDAHRPGVRSAGDDPTIYKILQMDIADGNPCIGEIGYTMEGDQRVGFVRFVGVDEPPAGTVIPLAHLGCNQEMGYFDKREFPQEKSEARHAIP